HPGPHAPALLHAKIRPSAPGGRGLPDPRRRADRDALRARAAGALPRAVERPGPGLRRRLRPRLAHALRLPVHPGGGEIVTASLVLPAYNEAGRIEECIRGVAEWVRSAPGGTSWEVILVDDGSTDDTVRRARDCAKSEGLALEVLTYLENRGKGAAI